MQEPALPSLPEVQQALAELYARPEFAPAPVSPLRLWLQSVWSAIREFLASIFPGLNLSQGGAQLVFGVVLVVLAVVTAIVVFHVLQVSREAWRGRLGRREEGRGKREEASGPRDASDWEEEARRAAAAGRWREATLALYQALLLRLEGRGALRYDPAKTPGDYRREVRRDVETRRALDAFLRLFEPVAFGGRPLDLQGYERLRAAAAEAGARG